MTKRFYLDSLRSVIFALAFIALLLGTAVDGFGQRKRACFCGSNEPPPPIVVQSQTTGSAQTFPLTSSLWLLDPEQPDQGQPYNKKGDLAFDFPVIPSPSYAGYLLLPWTQALTGSTLSAEIQVATFPFRAHAVYWIAPENGGCESPSKVYLFFQTQGLYNGTEGTQWWASLDSWEIADTLGGTVVVAAALDDPSRWYSVFGHPATQFPAEFANAKAHPTYVGLTFGGNCANGHGIQSKRGDSRFRLRSFGVFYLAHTRRSDGE